MLREGFKSNRSVIKYVELKIMGECLGGVLGSKRAEVHREMIAHAGLEKYVNDAVAKTLIFTSYVSVVKDMAEYFKRLEFSPVLVYGDTNKELTQMLQEFERNPALNPAIATYMSLSTAVPMTMASTAIMFNAPWRDHERVQARARLDRLGQTNPVTFVNVTLDTGSLPNISTRAQDILEWSKQQVSQIMGTDAAGLDNSLDGLVASTESMEERWVPFSDVAEYSPEDLTTLQELQKDPMSTVSSIARTAMSDVIGSEHSTGLEHYIEFSRLANKAGMEEFHQLQEEMGRLTSLAASMEAIEAAGQFNRGTAVLLMTSLESLGYEIEIAGLESLDDQALINTSMEGLGSVIAKVAGRFREWWSRMAEDARVQGGQMRVTANAALKEVAKAREKLKKFDDSTKYTVSINGLAKHLRVGKESPNLDLTAKYLTQVPKFIEAYLTATQKINKAAQSLASSVDLTSDKAYEDTVLKKAPSLLAMWFKEPVATYAPNGLIYSINETTAEQVSAIKAGKAPEYKGFPGGLSAVAASGTVANGPEQHLSRKDIGTALDAVEDFYRYVVKDVNIRRWNTIYEELYKASMELYMIEAGEARKSSQLPKLTKYRLKPGSLQWFTGPAWTYMDDGVFQMAWEAVSTSRALISLARRLVSEGKE